MTRKLPGATAACVLGVFSGAALAAPPPPLLTHTQRVYVSVTGNDCIYSVGAQTCTAVVALKEGDWAGSYTRTRVEITEYTLRSDGSDIRIVSCPMDDSRMQVAQKWAKLSVVVDTASPDCTHYGEKVIYDPFSVEPYSFTGTLVVDANWLNPGRQMKQNGITVQTDNVAGTQVRENCQFFNAFQMLGGGFTLQGVFHPFGVGDSNGDFSSNHCNTLDK